MDSHIRYTHELISYNEKTYIIGQRHIRKRIKRDFEKVDSIELSKLSDGSWALRVKGPVHLYGYKVEDGGFYDLMHTRYYPEYYEFVKNGEIINCSGKHMRMDLVKKV